MLRIDTWKDKYSTMSYAEFNKKFPSTFKVSENGKCLFKAVRITCHVQDDPGLVPLPLIKAFEVELNQLDNEGMSNADIKKFVAFLRKNRAPLACNVFGENKVKHSLNRMEDLAKYWLSPGVYVVGATGATNMKHCFVLRVYEEISERRVFDRWYEGGEDHEYYAEPLTNLGWIRCCNFIRRVKRVSMVPRKRAVAKTKSYRSGSFWK